MFVVAMPVEHRLNKRTAHLIFAEKYFHSIKIFIFVVEPNNLSADQLHIILLRRSLQLSWLVSIHM